MVIIYYQALELQAFQIFTRTLFPKIIKYIIIYKIKETNINIKVFKRIENILRKIKLTLLSFHSSNQNFGGG